MIEITLNGSDARDAHIAASKHGISRDSEAMKKLHEAFPDDDEDIEDAPSGVMSFSIDPGAAMDIAEAAQEHASERRSRGHGAPAQKFDRIGKSIESQVVRGVGR